MGIADRIILTLYTILMTVASVLTLLCSLGVFSDTGMVAFISHIPGNWVYAVGGVIMLLVSVRLLITGLGLTGVSSLKLSDSDKGKVLVGKGALEDYIAVLSQEIYGIHHVKVIEPNSFRAGKADVLAVGNRILLPVHIIRHIARVQ